MYIMYIASLYNVHLLQFFADSLCVVFKVILYKSLSHLYLTEFIIVHNLIYRKQNHS